MADPNITEVHLLNVPLENDYRHTIWFPDAATQESYFKGKVKRSYTDFSYQRKDGYIRVPAGYDSVVSLGVNYVMYRNKAYSNKWFYAFITHIEYKDDGRTDIHIETDVMQTWLFNHDVLASFIEREHCFNDDVGANTQPENLETGEYVVNQLPEYGVDSFEYAYGRVDFKEFTDGYNIIIGSTVDASNPPSHDDNGEVIPLPYCGGQIYNGIYGGVKYFFMESTAEASYFLGNAAEAGQSDAIVSVFLLPKKLCQLEESGGDATLIGSWIPKYLMWSSATDDISDQIIKPHTINGYNKVRNNKLFTYPYCYLMMTNNAGADTVYHYELFGNDVCTFGVYGTITPGGSVRLVPMHYANCQENVSHGISGAKYPICSWASDVYTNWLTQNSMNLTIAERRADLSMASANLAALQSISNGAMSVAGSAAMRDVGGVATGLTDTAFGVANATLSAASAKLEMDAVVAQKYQHSLTPPEARGNVNSGDVTFSMGLSTFSAYHMSIKEEYARIIDKYFDMYGYATNLVKRPYKNHRESYWYIKTIGVNVDGAIPNTDLNIIKNCYNNGITFWRHTAIVGDYTQSNNIVN